MTWDGSPGRFTDEQYARSCVLDRGPEAGTAKQRYGLPVREPDGTLNCDAVSAALARIGQVKGATPPQIGAARSKLEALSKQCSAKRSRPEPGEVEERSVGELTVEDRKLRGVIPYGQQSHDLGGFREIIEPRALHNADLSNLIVTVDHAGLPLGRYPGTLTLEDRDDGMHWSVEPPQSRADVIEAVERGDLRASSWRMVVARDRWDGDVRHVEQIRSLRDVAIVTSPAYPTATAELRQAPDQSSNRNSEPEPEEAPVPDDPDEEVTPTGGGLTVESRSQNPDDSIETRVLDAIRSVPRGETRALTNTTAAEISPLDIQTFLWDLLRDNSVVLQSGVRVVTTQRQSIKWPQLTQDMEADFYSELDEIVSTDLEFEDWELTPVKIAALARASSEVVEDSDPDVQTVITSNLSTILALKFDRECLVGPSSGKGFDGLSVLAGQSLDAGGTLTNYDPFIRAFGLLAEAHIGPPYVIVTHPRVVTALNLIKEFTTAQSNTGVAPPPNFPPMYVTSQVGVEDDVTTALVYAPRLVTVVRRVDTQIEVDRSREFELDSVLFRGRVRATIGTAYPAAIVRVENIAAPPIDAEVEDDEE